MSAQKLQPVLLLLLILLRFAGVLRRPPTATIVKGLAAIAIGVLLLLQCQRFSGALFAPVVQIRPIVEGTGFLKSLSPDKVDDYWDLANPGHYSGILGLDLLVGGAGLLLGRGPLVALGNLVFSAALTGLYLVRVSVAAWSRDSYAMHSDDLVAFGLATGLASLLSIFLWLPRTKGRVLAEAGNRGTTG